MVTQSPKTNKQTKQFQCCSRFGLLSLGSSASQQVLNFSGKSGVHACICRYRLDCKLSGYWTFHQTVPNQITKEERKKKKPIGDSIALLYLWLLFCTWSKWNYPFAQSKQEDESEYVYFATILFVKEAVNGYPLLGVWPRVITSHAGKYHVPLLIPS